MGPLRGILTMLAIALSALGGAGVSIAAEFSLVAPGLSKDQRSRLQASSLAIAAARIKDTEAVELVISARADYARLLGALYELGYFGASLSITADGREVSGLSVFEPPARVQDIVITVDPGPVYTFGAVSITPDPPSRISLEKMANPGQPASVSQLKVAIAAVQDSWRAVGHPFSRVTAQDIVADHRNRTIAAKVTIDPGPKAVFGRLHITGTARTRDKRVREIAGLPTGEAFSPADLDRSAARLRRTGTFRSVSLEEASALGPGNTLDITARLEDAPPRRFGVGAEASSVEGIGLTGFWLHRNLRSGAERLRVDGEVRDLGSRTSGPDSMFSVVLSRPATFTPDTALKFSAALRELDEVDLAARSVEVGLAADHIFSDTLSGSAGIGLRGVQTRDDYGLRFFRLVTVPVAMTYDVRDNAMDAQRGTYAKLDTTGFVGLAGAGSGVRLHADLRRYVPFGDATTLAARAQLGSVIGPSIADVPPDYLFWSGGGGTVRGHAFQSLGVTVGGNASGGRSFAGLSLEVRHRLNGPFGIVGFVDTGFVGATALPGQQGAWQTGAGLGLRYASGLGPIRLDVATPIGGSGVSVYVGIGQAF